MIKDKITNKTKQIRVYLLITGIILILGSCNNGKKVENSEESSIINKAFLENVETFKVVFSNQEQELILTGKVEYDPDKIISYIPLISGIVDRTYFSLGDKVHLGQSLLDVRSTELTALQSEKITLEAEGKVAERELKTAQSLFDDNVLSERELLEAKSRLQQIQAELNKINSDMSIYGADKGNGIFTVHAPMSGYIVHKKASTGRMISPDSDEVFTIADLSTVWVIANVYASNLLFVREGMEVEITTLSYPDEVFYGKINSLSQVFDPEEKVLKARIVMPNNDLKFKPEMFVVVKLKNEIQQKCLSIPTDALIFDDDRYFMVSETASDKFEIVEVLLQGHYQQTSYISSGLNENDKMVVKNQLLIYSELKGK